jgi:hypothetical protein
MSRPASQLEHGAATDGVATDGAATGDAPHPELSHTQPAIQRFPSDAGGASAEASAPAAQVEAASASTEAAAHAPAAVETPAPVLIVEDSVVKLEPGQMRKSEFLAQLRTQVCSTAEDALSGTLWSAVGCPWVDRWFNYYSDRDSQQVQSAVHRYAPETVGITTASELIPVICGRVRRAIVVWSVSGKMNEDVPTGLPLAGVGEEGGESNPASGNVWMKEREGASGDSQGSRVNEGQLGSGRALEGGVRRQLESAYGEDFSRVRVHTDSNAAGLSASLEARAFTVGEDIAFGGDEYKPGTPVGDALIAHELAHVVQQRSGTATEAAAQKGATEQGGMEEDADQAAVRAIVSIWGGARSGLANVAGRSMPSLRSGLRLQRCGNNKTDQKKGTLLEDYAAKFPDAAELIRKSEPAMAVVTEAEAAGAKFGGYSLEGPGKDDWPYTMYGKVYVPQSQTDKIIAMRDFIFELTNAMHAPLYAELSKQAVKGAAGTLTAKEFARRIVEQEVEGMLRLGKVWFETKKGLGGGAELDKYDEEFFLSKYKDFTDGKKTKEDIVKEVLASAYVGGSAKGVTIEQNYINEYNRLSSGK